jgi:hypothetical protein
MSKVVLVLVLVLVTVTSFSESFTIGCRRLLLSAKARDITVLQSTAPRSSPPKGYSYVEGSEYGNLEDELDAMGGDPAFLDSFSERNVEAAGDDGNDGENDGWDGEVIEDAYFD